MRRFWFRILIALAMFHVASGSAAPPALAGFWAELWNQATGASKPGPDANGIAAAAAVIKSLAPAGDRTALAAEASPEGHWRLVNRAGETVTAANPDELARALNVLAPELAGDAKARLALYLTEDTVFRQRGSLLQLPSADLNLVVGTQTYKLQKGAPDSALRQSTMVASLSPRLMAGLADRADFDETLAQLDRPLAKAQIRVIALEPGGDGTLPSSPRIDAATQRAVTDSVDPDTLRYRLSNLRGQTALVTGRVDGGLLYFKPSSGPDRSLLLGDLVAAADASDVNLIVLQSTSTRQPGARNWLWLRVEVQNLDTAPGHGKLADFLTSLTGDQRMLVATRTTSVHTTRHRRTTLDIKPFAGDGILGFPAANPIAGAFNDILAEVTAKVPVQGITAYMRSAARERELSHRFIPGIPSWLQIGYAAALMLGIAGFPVARPWWTRVWPPEQRADYGTGIGFQAARIIRGALFGLLFLPLAGPLAVVALPFRRRRKGTPSRP